MTAAARSLLAKAALQFEDSRQTNEATAADPRATPEDRFVAGHNEFVRSVVLQLAAENVLRKSLH